MSVTSLPELMLRIVEASRTSLSHPSAEVGLARTLLPMLDVAVTSGICDSGGITQRSKDQLRTVASTGSLARQLDGAQYSCGDGPCLQAASGEDVQISQDLSAELRWPDWTPSAEQLGTEAVLSVQLGTDRDRLGALNLYSDNARLYSTEDLLLARFIAAHASIALFHHQQSQNLWIAIEARHRIGVAQGILRSRYHLNSSRSFEVLKRLSSGYSMKLAQVAELIIEHDGIPEKLRDPSAQISPGLAPR